MDKIKVLNNWAQLIACVSYNDWVYDIKLDGDRPYLQISFSEIDTVTNEMADWTCRKWFLSYHMTDSEVVQTAFLATKTAIQHELRESFKYRDEAIFRPHFDIEALHEVCVQGRVSKRKAA